MLRRFPGRTLEEIDGADYGRFMRAMEAERAESIERKRAQSLQNQSRVELTEEEWAQVGEHDKWHSETQAK